MLIVHLMMRVSGSLYARRRVVDYFVTNERIEHFVRMVIIRFIQGRMVQKYHFSQY